MIYQFHIYKIYVLIVPTLSIKFKNKVSVSQSIDFIFKLFNNPVILNLLNFKQFQSCFLYYRCGELVSVVFFIVLYYFRIVFSAFFEKTPAQAKYIFVEI